MGTKIKFGRRGKRSVPDASGEFSRRQVGNAGPDGRIRRQLGLTQSRSREPNFPTGLVRRTPRRGNNCYRYQYRGNRGGGEEKRERRKGRAWGWDGERSDFGLRALQKALLVCRIGSRQELLVDVLVGLRVTLQLLQLHECLTVDQYFRLNCLELLLQRFLLIELSLIFRFCGFDVLLALELDLPVEIVQLAVRYHEVGMAIAEHRTFL